MQYHVSSLSLALGGALLLFSLPPLKAQSELGLGSRHQIQMQEQQNEIRNIRGSKTAEQYGPDDPFNQEKILQADYQKAIDEAAKLQQLAADLKAELEKSNPHILDVSSLKRTAEIEKLAKKLRSHLSRF